MRKFLTALRPGGPWTLSAIDPSGGGAVPTFTFCDIDRATEWAAEKYGKYNLYFQPNRTRHVEKRASRADIDLLEYACVDIDKGEKSATVDALIMSDAPPTFINDSGGGIQAFWRLASPLTNTPENAQLVESINQGLIDKFGGDPGTWDVSRLMRLPGTINLPNAKKLAAGRVAVPAKILTCGAAAYEVFELPSREVHRTEVDYRAIDTDLIENLADLTEYNLPGWLTRTIRDGYDVEDSRPEWDGDRSRWLFKAVVGLIRAGVPESTIKGIILNPDFEISAHIYAQKGYTPEKYAERQILRAAARLLLDPAAEFADAPAIEGAAKSAAPGAPAREKFRIWEIDDIMALPPVEWRIEKLIPRQGLAQIFGEPGSYKSFIVLDMALHIATGRNYLGIETKQCNVLYVLGEGKHGIKSRIQAWKLENGVDDAELRGKFRAVLEPVLLDQMFTKPDGSQGGEGVDFVNKIAKLKPTKFIIFDTLNRHMTGDENSTQEMGRFIQVCDKIKDEFEACVMIAHHSGTQEKGRGRGASALPGALDTSIHAEKTKNKFVKMVVRKQKDGPEGDEWDFERHDVMIDPDDIKQTAPVLRIRIKEEKTEAVQIEEQILQDIAAWDLKRPPTGAQLAKNREGSDGFARASVYRAIKILTERGLIEADNGKLVPTAMGEEHARKLLQEG